ncbi:MAG: WYL domain-containing protein [Actinomycetales bacterium]|nr:WYL domain-containing protein [Actinomycetales bacterium]
MSDATGRAIRLLDLVPFLRANPGMNIKEIATEFKVSVSEIVSDLDLLMVCGLPGYTPLELIDLSTDEGYVTLRDPQNLEYPRNFTIHELLILKIALSALLVDSPPMLHSEIGSLISKLDHQMPNQISSEGILFVPDNILNLRRIGEEALVKNQQVEISYRNDTKDELTNRKISLIREYESEGEYFWDAWCHLANAKRTFNLEKISSATLSMDPSSIGDLSGESAALTVRLRIRQKSQFFAKHQNILKQTEEPEIYEARIYQREWLVREILSAGETATVITPNDLKVQVKKRATQALSQYQ